MNPYDEQRLRDEVIYLHSLWYQGPPSNHRKPKPPQQTHNPSINLHTLTNPTPFKKQASRHNKNLMTITMTTSWSQPDPNRNPDSGPEWPIDPVPSPQPTTTGWPEFKPKAPKEPVSEQDQAILSAFQLQNKVVQCCREFFSKRVNEDEESDESDEDDEEYEEHDEEEESEEYRFLLDVFVNDDKLRDYYEMNHENGGFCCLVCRGIGENLSKRYKDCLGLVQHAIAVSKTKRRRTHRAFGKVVCKVLGWDFDRLPVIVLKGDPLGKSLSNSSTAQGEEARGNVDNDKEDMTKDNREIKIVEKEVSSVSQKDGEVKVCEESLKVDDARNCVQNLDAKVLNVEAYKEVAVECQESNPSLVPSNSWSCIEPVDKLAPIASGWPTLKPKKPLVIQLASAEDQMKLAAVELQHKVSEACREFFEKNAGSEGDEDDEEEEDIDEDEDSLMDQDESEDSENFKFFLKVFSENCELRNYYEKNYEAGEFCCLVCGGIGKKVWKRFKDCLGLLQHSTAISNTKKQAHRAFGQVVCKVLGWDVDRLPTIVSKGEPLGQSLAKSGVLQNSSIEDNTIKDVNDICQGILETEGNKEGATDVLVP
ncbi:hypothetical protein Ddye_026526 [Dipteronia dyeriana]|uniref:Uncharacterized protein n=1 Tax=Dipteronia dyeriana TaxID=168575 RepID=A0AAD9WPM3_9ROSI|nr:hypothetical protein Ddye_026526 [Dipteronia dyeriana]